MSAARDTRPRSKREHNAGSWSKRPGVTPCSALCRSLMVLQVVTGSTMVFPITSWVAVNALGLLECRLCQEAVARLYFKKRAPTLTDLSINATC